MPPAPAGHTAGVADTTVVVMSRDRRDSLLRTLGRLAALPERPPIVVVDNGSTDGTAAAVAGGFPDARVVRLPDNIGAPARTIGAGLATTPYVAFADDDSWWDPGALTIAAAVLDGHPSVALVAARILVGDDGRDDPTNAAMAASPLGDGDGLPGPRVLGFLACGAIVRRDAFLAVGGFDDLLFFFGEEDLLAIDLADAGWDVCYVDTVVARHDPDPPSDGDARRQRELRNSVLTTWLRRPAGVALAETARAAAVAARDPVARRAAVELVARLPRVLGRRRAITPGTEAALRAIGAGR